jgi:hypothetical protein
MVFAKRPLILLGVLLVLPAANAAAQSQLEKACVAEIRHAEATIAAKRKAIEYQSDQGRRVLSTADRYVYQARQYSMKGQPRGCVTTAQKVQEQLTSR